MLPIESKHTSPRAGSIDRPLLCPAGTVGMGWTAERIMQHQRQQQQGDGGQNNNHRAGRDGHESTAVAATTTITGDDGDGVITKREETTTTTAGERSHQNSNSNGNGHYDNNYNNRSPVDPPVGGDGNRNKSNDAVDDGGDNKFDAVAAADRAVETEADDDDDEEDEDDVDGDDMDEDDNADEEKGSAKQQEEEDGLVVPMGVCADKKSGSNNNNNNSKSITRIRYSNDFKVKVLDELELSNVTVAEMARRHKLPEATLRDWVKTKDKITTAQVNRRGSAKSNSRDNLQKITDALRTFMDLNDRLGACGMSKLPITNAMIAKQGQEVKALLLEKDAEKPFLTAQERKTINQFNASIWWSKKWARKHNLHSVGHREAAKAAAALSSQVPAIRKEYSRDHVFFVVDSMLFYKVLPTRSYIQNVSGGSRTTTTTTDNNNNKKLYQEQLKDRLSLFICANSSGTHKIPLTMMSDVKNPPSFIANRQKLFPYIHQEKAWADPKSLLLWWKDVFLPDIREWTDDKVLLVLQKPSIVDLEDPQEQVSVKFLPPMLAHNHNSSTEDGLSVSSFFEPPTNMLSVVKSKYRYELLKEVLQIFEEREQRRRVSAAAQLPQPGLKQGNLPHLQDCMRILHTVWTNLPSSAISSSSEEDCGTGEDGRKKKRRKRRKRKGTSENDIVENEAMGFSDELGTDELIKDIIHFFRKNNDDVVLSMSSITENDDDNPDNNNPLDKSVSEVKSCFLNEQLLLKPDQEELRKIIENWIGLEDSQEIRTMLQAEILSGMKFRLILGVDDDVDDEEEESSTINTTTLNNGGGGSSKGMIGGEKEEVNEEVALDCATLLLQCAVRLSKENSAFHDLASQLIEASDAAFVALREAKLPPELRKKREPAPPPKKRKRRTTSGPRKKRSNMDDTGEGNSAAADKTADDDDDEAECEKETAIGDTEKASIGEAVAGAEEKGEANNKPEEGATAADSDYDGAVFEI